MLSQQTQILVAQSLIENLRTPCIAHSTTTGIQCHHIILHACMHAVMAIMDQYIAAVNIIPIDSMITIINLILVKVLERSRI
jgi:hypothetical protein